MGRPTRNVSIPRVDHMGFCKNRHQRPTRNFHWSWLVKPNPHVRYPHGEIKPFILRRPYLREQHMVNNPLLRLWNRHRGTLHGVHGWLARKIEVFEVKATNGDTSLGGEDFDHAIVAGAAFFWFLIDFFSEKKDQGGFLKWWVFPPNHPFW